MDDTKRVHSRLGARVARSAHLRVLDALAARRGGALGATRLDGCCFFLPAVAFRSTLSSILPAAAEEHGRY